MCVHSTSQAKSHWHLCSTASLRSQAGHCCLSQESLLLNTTFSYIRTGFVLFRKLLGFMANLDLSEGCFVLLLAWDSSQHQHVPLSLSLFSCFKENYSLDLPFEKRELPENWSQRRPATESMCICWAGYRSEFLNLSTIDILSQRILCWGRGGEVILCPAECLAASLPSNSTPSSSCD